MVLALPFPAIDPILVEIGPFAIRWYALAYIAGLVLGWLYGKSARSATRACGAASRAIRPCSTIFWSGSPSASSSAARLGHVLFYDPAYYAANPLEILQVWHGGMAFHGGLLGAVLAIILFARRARRAGPVLSRRRVGGGADRPVPRPARQFRQWRALGPVTDVPWALVFPHAGPEPRHPSQLYEAGLEGVAALSGAASLATRLGALKRPGLVAGVFGIGYALCALDLASCSASRTATSLGPVTIGMALSLPLARSIGLGLVWQRAAARKPAPMTTPLGEESGRRSSRAEGPITVVRYMALASAIRATATTGRATPSARGGDFVTAPEISQMFGELIGLWAAHAWTRARRARSASRWSSSAPAAAR